MGGNETLDVRLYETGHSWNHIPQPTPAVFVDAWDKDHVKMPCSPRSLYVENKVSVRRWDVIQRVLSQKIDSATAFQIAVNTYNNRYARTWNVDCLSAALRQRPDFVPLLQKIADLALKAPDLVTQPVPLLRQNKERSLSLSQLQIACLLANAFYSTFPRRNATGVNSEYSDFPTINFSSLFCGTGYTDESNVEKIICLLHYFSRVFDKDGPPSGTVTFTRRCLHSPPDFSVSEVLVGSIPFGVSSSCLIEDTQGTALHVSCRLSINAMPIYLSNP
uniref:PARG helical domain-containing protein n=2 Tax=Schistocephalus solidus TaxID=70667 RepID=A0A0X3PFZ5_SCHSO